MNIPYQALIHHARLVAITLLIIIALDYAFLNFFAKAQYLSFFQAFGRAGKSEFNILLPQALWAWLWLAIGHVFFVLPRAQASGGLMSAFGWGALYGYVVYGVYNFTNWATMTSWTANLTQIDVTWGTLSQGVVAAAVWVIAGLL